MFTGIKDFFGQCIGLSPNVDRTGDKPVTSTGNKDQSDKIALIQNRLNSIKNGTSANCFEKSLHQELHRNWLYQRTVQQNTYSPKVYSGQRSAELGELPGAEDIAGQYGCTLASAHYPSRNQLPQLTIDHQIASGYLRQVASKEHEDHCQAIYEQYDSSNAPAIFVNSRHAAEQILSHLSHKPRWQGDSSQLLSNLKELQPGLLALPLPGRAGIMLEEAEGLVTLYGARPSAYAVSEGINGPVRAVIDDPQIDNIEALKNLKGTAENSVAERLRAFPQDLGPAMLARSAASMIDNLVNVLERPDVAGRIRHNPILANGLKVLHSVADSLSGFGGDSYKFSNCYEALIEEIQVCLSAAKPYDQSDFRTAALTLLAPQYLTETTPVPEVKLVSSGMGALNLGLEVALKMTGSSAIEFASVGSKGKTPVYFEVEKLVEGKVIQPARTAAAVYATLNPNIPSGHSLNEKEWGVDSVIQAIDTRLKSSERASQQVVLVLDATVEKRGDMDRLISRFNKDIDHNRLSIVVCKSYQKFANLCSAKVMAGGIGIVSGDNQVARNAKDFLDRVEKDLNWMEHNDGQLMTHFLRSREHEFNLLDRSIENARYVSENFFHGKDSHTRFDGISKDLPFVLLADNKSRDVVFGAEGEDGVLFVPGRGQHLGRIRVLDRAGFAFTKTTLTSKIPDAGGTATRISFGQESQAELTENFYAASRLMKKKSSAWGCREAYDLIQKLADGALKGNKTSHLCLGQKMSIIADKERPRLDDIERQASNPTDLRQQLQRNGAGGMTLNKIVSILNHLGDFTLNHTDHEQWQYGRERELLDEMLQGLIQSGMPGVSSTGRTSILELEGFMCAADMRCEDEHQQQRGLQRLIDTFVRIPHPDSMLECLDLIPDEVFGSASTINQERAIRALFLPLDTRARQTAIERQIQFLSTNKAEACMNAFEASVDRASPLVAETFHSSQHPTINGTLSVVKDDEVIDLRSSLLKQRVDLASREEFISMRMWEANE